MELTLKPEYGYVLGATVASFFVHHVWMSSKVMAARKKYDVKYPALYADEKNCPNEQYRTSFNCVQRAHQNSFENHPINLAMWCLGGIKYPITCAVGAGFYLLGRILYFQGYSTGNPEARYRGAVQYIGVLANLGCCLKFAYDLLSSKK